MSLTAAAETAKPARRPRLEAIEYIRGISMLGVIGIHTGSQYLMNPSANIHLVALFEVASRFSVPIFFFISAFGLFYNMDINKKLNLKNFYLRRIKTVMVPYLVWSAFYMLHYVFLYRDYSILTLKSLAFKLFFGDASYQLYFLVILLWFYLLMPVWIYLIKRINLAGLAALFIVQVAFDYFSSYSLRADGISHAILKALINYRLNYWVLHYVFIFVLGGWLAVHADKFKLAMKNYRKELIAFFVLSLAGILGYYYKLLYVTGYTPLEAINTAHQLSPIGIVYTIAASLFFFTIFTDNGYPAAIKNLLHLLGKHSYFAYLVHPIFITYIIMIMHSKNIVMTAPKAIAFYFAITVLSIISAVIVRRIGQVIPVINALTIGVWPKKNTM